MEKEAKTKYELIPEIKKRWSPRAFADKQVNEDQIAACLEAASWAASSFNEQPWRFIFARKTDKEAYDKLFACLNEWNQFWAQNAPVLLLTFYKTHFSRENALNQHAKHDLGQAAAHLALQATKEGLHVHQMAGILPHMAYELFEIPEGYEVCTAIAMGYRGDPEMLKEDMKESESATRHRKSLGEIAQRGQFPA